MTLLHMLSAAAALLSVTNVALAADVCNGHAELCNIPYSNVTFVGAHDSPFSSVDGNLPSDNQDLSVADILKLGIRYLQGQTHKNVAGDFDLCHTNCLLLDAGTVVNFLGTVKTFLDSNPNEVVSILLTNGDNLDVSVFGSAFQNASIVDYAYVPPSNPLPIGSWPTLGDLIDSGKRLVVFLDYGADATKVPYILDEFAYYFETPFDVTNSSDFDACPINRPPNASPDGRMYIVNHFLDMDIFSIDVPNKGAAGTTNAAQGDGSIGEQAAVCEGLYGRAPNAIFLDWVDIGDAIKAQNELNGLS